jgi:hypothetical protein
MTAAHELLKFLRHGKKEDVHEYLMETLKTVGDGKILYDSKTKMIYRKDHAPKHLLKRAKRDRGLLIS